jgi:hypothetical protein
MVFMHIDSKLPAFKNFLTENKMSTQERSATVDNANVASAGQKGILLDMNEEDSSDPYSDKKKKKNKKQQSKDSAKSELVEQKKTDEEFRSLTFKLLNLL